ncbi:MAG TPA: deoxyribodipyrimidine photolyase, partial [Bacteroidetes bacterium]|nr:deoxyribodipyrimidine photolyase [Bacteroidota bacterium]
MSLTLLIEQAFTPIGLKLIKWPKNQAVEIINIVWFKRDLRISDHKPLQSAIEEGCPLLLLYIQEPDLWEDDHMDHRHNRCVYQSLQSVNGQLAEFNQRIVVIEGNPLDVFQHIHQHCTIHHVFSHQETGLKQTYRRDIQLKDFFLESSIIWKEFQRNGVVRGLKNRDTWRKAWYHYMNSPIDAVDQSQLPHPPVFDSLPEFDWPAILTTGSKQVQSIGLEKAQNTMTSFLTERGRHYMQNISKPETSATHCSRLSPFLVYGNLSIRQVFQAALKQKEFGWKRNMASFRSRLRWHDHFIQKFE